MPVNTFIVPLKIEADAYQQMYRGNARHVVARDIDGRTIQLPAAALRPFVTREGIEGVFIVQVDEANRLIDISRRGE